MSTAADAAASRLDSASSAEAQLPSLKRALRSLNEKINKLYSWHLVEIDLVAKQQMQLNDVTHDLECTRKALLETLSQKSFEEEKTRLEQRITATLTQMNDTKKELEKIVYERLRDSVRADMEAEPLDEGDVETAADDTPKVKVQLGVGGSSRSSPSAAPSASQSSAEVATSSAEEKSPSGAAESAAAAGGPSSSVSSQALGTLLAGDGEEIDMEAVEECLTLVEKEHQATLTAISDALRLTDAKTFSLDNLLDYKNLLKDGALFSPFSLPESFANFEWSRLRSDDDRQKCQRTVKICREMNGMRESLQHIFDLVEKKGLFSPEAQGCRRQLEMSLAADGE